MIITTALLLIAQGAETPDYRHWASCNPGSWVRSRIDTRTPEFTLAQEATIRLIRVDKDAAYVEVIQRVYSDDTLVSAQVSQRAIPARIEADLGIVRESEEILELAGRKFKCRRVEVRRDVGGTPFEMSFWNCPDVPGGTVKSEGGPVGEKAPSNRMTVLEWRKESPSGIDDVSTRAEAEKILKKVEETLAGAKTLRFDYARTYDGAPLNGSFAREGDRLHFSFTEERKREGPLRHTRVSDGREFALAVNERKAVKSKVQPGLGANAIAVMLHAAPESLDPWFNVEEGIPLRSAVELSDLRTRGSAKVGALEAVVLEFLRGKPGDGANRSHVTLWVDGRRLLPLKRLVIPASEEPKYVSRLEETFSNFVLDSPIPPETFQIPRE